MNTIVVYVVGSLRGILGVLRVGRAIMCWLVQGRIRQVDEFLCRVNGPLVQPVRCLLGRIDVLRGCPFDFAFMLAFLVLIALEQILYML